MVAFRPSTRSLFLSVSFAVVTLATIANASAQHQVWIGDVSSDWRDGNNWSGGTPPAAPFFAQGSNGTLVPLAPFANMPRIDGGALTIGNALLGYSHEQGGLALTITNGAELNSGSVVVGEGHNSMPIANRFTQSGVVDVLGASTWNTDNLTIGSYGDGVVNVSGTSKIVAGALTLGTHRDNAEFGKGELTVSGPGSQVTVTSNATAIGNGGEGIITVNDGGKLVTDSAALGVNAQSAGTVTISGPSSRWERAGGTLNVGQSGTGNIVVENGGVVSFLSGAGNVNMATSSGSSATISVTGSGSQFNAGWVNAGQQSTATIDVSNGGLFKATYLMLGAGANGVGTATLSGSGSAIEATLTRIGHLGEASLTLANNAALRGEVNIGNSSNVAGKGTLNIGAVAGSAAAAAGTIEAASISFGTGANTLVFNHTGTNYNFASNLSGGATNTIRHLAGTTNLAGNGAGFTGSTIVDGGRLNLLQALGGTVTVNNTGTFGGTGTVGTTTVNSGGTIDTGGKLNVTGNLTFSAGSQYIVEVDNGHSGEIAVTGTVSITDTGVIVRPVGMQHATESHRVLSGSLLTDTFAGISSTSAFVDARLDYSKANEIWVELQRNDVKFDEVASNANQQGVGQVMTNLPLSNPLVVAMTSLSAPEAQKALDELSGDASSTVSTVGSQVAGQVQGVVMNRVRQSFSALGSGGSSVSSYWPGGYDGNDEDSMQTTFWLQGLGEYTHIRPTAAAGGMDAGTGGVLGGGDILLDDWRIGAVAGYTGTSFNALGRSAKGNVQNLHAGIYAGAELDAVRLQFNALQTWHSIASTRNVTIGGFTDTLTADYAARTSLLYGELGYSFDLGSTRIEPFGSASYTLTQTDAYAEAGGAAALTSAATSNESVTTVVGLRSSASIAVQDKLVTLNGMLGWQHQSGQAPTSQYTLAGSTPFTVTGANTASNALVYEAGINLDLSEQFNVDVVYSGRLSSDDLSHGIKGIIAASF